MAILMDYILPGELDVVAVVPWSDKKKATPVSDFLNVRFAAMCRYGVDFKRLSLHSETARVIAKTDEFQAMAIYVMCPPPPPDRPPGASFYFKHFGSFILRMTTNDRGPGLYAPEFDARLPVGVVTLCPMDGQTQMHVGRIRGL